MCQFISEIPIFYLYGEGGVLEAFPKHNVEQNEDYVSGLITKDKCTIRFVIPYNRNKNIIFENFGYKCSLFPNLVDKDILIQIKRMDQNVQYHFFSLRNCITSPELMIYIIIMFSKEH